MDSDERYRSTFTSKTIFGENENEKKVITCAISIKKCISGTKLFLGLVWKKAVKLLVKPISKSYEILKLYSIPFMGSLVFALRKY